MVARASARVSESDFLLPTGTECLCVITAVEGPSARPLGAAMTVASDGSWEGTLSSGCVEADIALHAQQALATGVGKLLRYGRGGPVDLRLPCGGSLEVTVVPRPDPTVLAQIRDALIRRQHIDVWVGAAEGLSTAAAPGALALTLLPRLRLAVVGRGAEATLLVLMAKIAGIEVDQRSSDGTLPPGARLLPPTSWPDDLVLDDRSAVALFFHDHDREPPLLAHALASRAFYVGALGSAAAAAARAATLRTMGVPETSVLRIAEPFGLVPHARDPATVAAGVLAQILGAARNA